MSDQPHPGGDSLSASRFRRVDQLCDRFEDAWKRGRRPQIEDYLGAHPEPERSALLREFLSLELAYRRQNGETPILDEYRRRFPEHAELVHDVFREARDGVGPHARGADSSGPGVATRPEPVRGEEAEQPASLGRYRITGKLGKGAFGVVYQGYDDDLRRVVAIKVPHHSRVAQPEDVEAYLAEARIVADLDHPHIVPVYDVGHTDDGLCYVVSKFIEGRDVAKKIKEARPSFAESAELVATVAEALHYAHRRGLVHRDIKPGNILIDAGGKPYVADFGLALKEENIGQGPKYAGTPAYMSPEQARGEGHRVDGRTDIFSLGVVFYELLTGRRPFQGDSKEQLLEQITDFEPRPPRQCDDSIPKELERICFKALSKRAVDRYSTAKDMADDLRHLLAQQTVSQQAVPASKGVGSPLATPVLQPSSIAVASGPAGTSSTTATTPTSDSRPIKIVPKGLRSFDEHDADFFLELLSGPRDREGLPDSIRFWKTKIEETDPEKTFAVGLICGPSGCGKSSLVKAGLLPRLSNEVLVVYLEATAEETETRLLKGLRKRCPGLPANLGLREELAALRRGQGIPVGKKVLIILDQFEQWLHAKKEEENTELVQALRHCDGGRVQCLVLVRDDFWMAVIRFMRDLEIRLIEGQNSAAVDLFPLRHAEKVLAAFGRAFGVLPDSPSETSKEQKEFLTRAVSGLAQENKVICVRLALFAEMMKGRPWSPASLRAVGGTEGIGVTFLEETFSSATAPPEHRYHQKAAQGVLKALLPDAGSDIKGHLRSQQELLEGSRYTNRPRDFDELLGILDSELRLLTPTDPEGQEGEESTSQVKAGEKYYQLTHDYLVHSLRDWLTRKQKETRRGRAELRLAERAAAWNAKPVNRHLPAWWEWVNIRLFTRKQDWTDPQQKMLRKTTRYYAVRLFLITGVLLLTSWGLFEGLMYLNALSLVRELRSADTAQAPQLLFGLNVFQRWATPMLREMYEESDPQSKERLHASLALLPVDPGQVGYLYERLLNAGPTELLVIREALLGYRDHLVERLWQVLDNAQEDPGRRFRAACVLATYDPWGDAKGERWQNASKFVTDQLLAAVQKNPSHYPPLLEMLRPVRKRLIGPLAEAFRNRERPESERSFATTIVADYASDQPTILADLLMDAEAKSFAVLYRQVAADRGRAVVILQGTINTALASKKTEEEKERLAKRQANAAVALHKMGKSEQVWPMLKHTPDPRVRSYLIHRLGPLGGDVKTIVKRLKEEADVTICRALVLSLGEFGEKALSPDERASAVEEVRELYRTAADPGLHGAAEWFLRQWKQDPWLKQRDEEWSKDKEWREQRLERIRRELVKEKGEAKPQWYVNGQGQTMVVLAGPVEFLMGSPPTEAGRDTSEVLHRQRIGRTFALATTHVTVEQFKRFNPQFGHSQMHRSPEPDCPVLGVTWYEAAAYCNWLSKHEGLPEDQWCYVPKQDGKFEEGMQLAPDYLRRTGYRLPTEAEWEYACRSGAVTPRFYGQSDELLEKYGWYVKNSGERTWRVGSLKPNDLGLFDMHGQLWVWCQERYKGYLLVRGGVEDIEDSTLVTDRESRVLRGGSFNYPAADARSANRNWDVPPDLSHVGFRAARSFR